MDSDDPGSKLFPALVAMFRPHVEALEMPRILAWARSPYSREEKKVLLGFFFSPTAMRAYGIATMVGQAFKVVFNRPRMSESQIEAVKEAWLTEATAMFVRGWINTLLRPTSNTDALDDAMLPAGSVPFAIMAAWDGSEQYSEEDVRGVLRAVKASLPPGQDLPTEALELVRLIREAEAHLFD